MFLRCSYIHSQNLFVNFTKIESDCVLGEASISIISGALPIQISWSNGSTSTSISQLETGIYSVKVTDNTNKDTTISFKIGPIICDPIVENYFTPNNDGYNDLWHINRIENFPDFELFIYNRWGQLVHYQTQQFIPWDGRSLTLPLPDATYYYILYPSKKNKNKFLKGDVSIIR